MTTCLLRRWSARIGFASVLASWGAASRAQEEPTRPLADAVQVLPHDDACLTRAALAERVGRWLAHAEVDATIEVEVHTGADGGTVWFVMRRSGTRTAERSFDVLPRECATRLDGVSLAIALAIDHTVLDRVGAANEAAALAAPPPATAPPALGPAAPSPSPSTATVGAPPSPAAPAAPPLPAKPVPAERRESRPSSLSLSASGGGFVALGTLPELAFAARLGGGLRVGSVWGLRLEGFATSEAESPLGRGTAAMRLNGVELAGCAGGVLRATRLDVCAGLGVGALDSAGHGFPMAFEKSAPWLAPVVVASVAFPADSTVALRFRLEGSFPVIRPGAHLEDSEGRVLDRVSLPAAGGRVGIDVVVGAP